MSYEPLSYVPKWSHVGDPEEWYYALAYGVLALAAIFLVEYIFGAILFSKADGIVISDAAAHITFSNSSWLEVFQWAFLKRPAKQTERRVCRRAVLAVFLRACVLIIDLAILFQSVPRSIKVLESAVGYSVMQFKDVPPEYEPESILEAISSPCKPDPIRYGGFKPIATRKLCFSSTIISRGSFNNTVYSNIDKVNNDVFSVYLHGNRTALHVWYWNSNVVYTYSHIMHIEEEDKNDVIYSLPPPVYNVQAVSNRLMKMYDGRCTTPRNTKTNMIIQCLANPEEQWGVSVLHYLFSLMEARAIKPGLRLRQKKYKDFVTLELDDIQVGEIERPTVCIIPAVMMLLSFMAVAAIMRCTKGKQDLSFKVWSYFSRCNESHNTKNPFFSDCKEFEKWDVEVSASPFH